MRTHRWPLGLVYHCFGILREKEFNQKSFNTYGPNMLLCLQLIKGPTSRRLASTCSTSTRVNSSQLIPTHFSPFDLDSLQQKEWLAMIDEWWVKRDIEIRVAEAEGEVGSGSEGSGKKIHRFRTPIGSACGSGSGKQFTTSGHSDWNVINWIQRR